MWRALSLAVVRGGHPAVQAPIQTVQVATLRVGAAARQNAKARPYPVPAGFEIDHKNVGFLSQFVSDNTGAILRRDVTGLTAKHQRQVARAIKRARAFGLMPYMYKLEQYKAVPTRRKP
mmetsp:Transcript_6139/g.15697  ORF Transcript_6139/g.15697 Transcript_6139/m.15697 type:complete len:119 (-) Transcript_6139:694-1050(-)